MRLRMWAGILLALTLCAPAQAANIASTADLADNSNTISDPSLYLLNPANHAVTAAVNIASDSRNGVAYSGGGTLLLDNTGKSPTLLTVNTFLLGAGSVVEATGGLSYSHGLAANAFTMTGGTLRATGGAAQGAVGVRVQSGGFVQDGGDVVATGGGGGSAEGLFIQSGGYVMNGGTLQATGGSNTNNTGARVVTGDFVMNDGVLTARGGSGNNANGMWVSNGNFIMHDGQASGFGSTGKNNVFGIRVNKSLLMDGGTLSVTGGSLGSSYGMVALGGVQLSGTGHVEARGGSGNFTYGLNTIGAAVTVSDSARLSAWGGSINSGHGVSAGSLTQSGNSVVEARGGTAGGAYGLAIGTYTLNSGTLSAWGNNGANARGASFTTAVQNGGTINAYGSNYKASNASTAPALFATNFTQTGGTINAMGGGGDWTRAMVANTSLTQNGNGTINASGGSGERAIGVATQNWILTSGSLSGTGGSGATAYGASATRMTLGDGTVTATGGSGAQAYGLYAGGLAQNSGELTAKSGAFAGSVGARVDEYTLNSGILRGIGGGAAGSTGMDADVMAQHGGAVRAEGGSAANAVGMISSAYTQYHGEVTAKGGSASQAYGIRANGFTQDGGDVQTTGGSGANAYGLLAVSAVQNSGNITARGGGGAAAYGMAASSFTQSAAGRIEAIAGSTADSYGLYIDGHLDVRGEMRLERPNGKAASVFVDTAAGGSVTLRGGSVFEPDVDQSNPDGNRGAGLLATSAGGRVTIEDGAVLRPFFGEYHRLRKSHGQYLDYVFIDTGILEGGDGNNPAAGGTIDGEFTELPRRLTIDYAVRKSADGSQYLISFERVMELPELVDLIPCENARRLAAEFEDLYESGAADDGLRRIATFMDESIDIADLNRRAAHIGLTITPQAYTKLTGTQLRTMELMQTSASGSLDRLIARGRADAAAESGEALPSLAWRPGGRSGGWRVWADSLYQQSSRFKAQCYEFDSPKEKLYGLSAGVARDAGLLGLAAAFGYVRGTYRSDYSDIGVNNFGVTLAAKVHDIVPGGDAFNPWVGMVAGYGYGDIDQKALNFPGTGWKRSSPETHMFRAGVEVGTDLRFGRATLTPSLGVEYAHIRQGGYAENDRAGFGARVYAGGYDSLRPKVALSLGYDATDRLRLEVSGAYRYETQDIRSAFAYNRLSAPGIVLTAHGEKRRRASGSARAGFQYRVNDRASLTAGYSLILEDGYAASGLSLGLGLDF